MHKGSRKRIYLKNMGSNFEATVIKESLFYELLVRWTPLFYQSIFHAWNFFMLAIKEVNDVIAGSTEVSDDPFVGGGYFFSIQVFQVV